MKWGFNSVRHPGKRGHGTVIRPKETGHIPDPALGRESIPDPELGRESGLGTSDPLTTLRPVPFHPASRRTHGSEVAML